MFATYLIPKEDKKAKYLVISKKIFVSNEDLNRTYNVISDFRKKYLYLLLIKSIHQFKIFFCHVIAQGDDRN